MIVKPSDCVHFTKDFGNGTKSDRIILPRRDGCRVKVTQFRTRAGFQLSGIIYPYDETCLVMYGALSVTVNGVETMLGSGSTFHVPAGQTYGLKVTMDSAVYCVFSAAVDGTMPEDE